MCLVSFGFTTFQVVLILHSSVSWYNSVFSDSDHIEFSAVAVLWGCSIKTVEIIQFSIDFPGTKPMAMQMKMNAFSSSGCGGNNNLEGDDKVSDEGREGDDEDGGHKNYKKMIKEI
ncbi:hypothetical protein V6N13_149144 [Hibiscus sabdariffa]